MRIKTEANLKPLDTKRETILRFICFLKQHKCFAAYIRRVLPSEIERLEKSDRSIYSTAVREMLVERLRLSRDHFFISGTFLWPDDEEQFWTKVARDWTNKLKGHKNEQ